MTNLLAFCDKATGGVYKGRGVHVVYLDLAWPLTNFSVVSITKLVRYGLGKWTMNERLAALPGSKSCDQWFKVQQPITSRGPQISPGTSTLSVFINNFMTAVLQ